MFISIDSLKVNIGGGNMFHTQLVEEEGEKMLSDRLGRGKSDRAVREFRDKIFVPATIGFEVKKFCIGISHLEKKNSGSLLPFNLLL